MKKMLCILLSVLLVLTCFVGCTQKEEAPPKPEEKKEETVQTEKTEEPKEEQKEETTGSKTLRVWIPPFGTEESMDMEFWNRTFDTFEAEHNVSVEVQVVPWSNYPEKYMSGVSGGNGPDVGYLYADIFPDFINMGAVREISDLITEEDRALYPYVEEGYILGGQYALPFILGNPRIIYFNKALLEDAGIPIPEEPFTWDEFRDMGKKLTIDKDGDGTIDQWSTTFEWGSKSYGAMQAIFTPFLLQAGGKLYADDGTTAIFGSEAGVRAAQFIHDLVYVDKIVPKSCTGMTADDTVEMFNRSETAFYFGNTSNARQINEDIDWSFVPCLKDKEAATMMVADQLVVMSACKEPDLAMELIRFMLSADVQAAFHKELSAYPPINVEEEFNDNPAFEELFAKWGHMLHTEKPVVGANKKGDYLYKNLQMVMMDQMDPAEAVTSAEDFCNTMVD